MDDRIRISDADRDRVAARLRDHFAEGRLTADELDERISATLNAKTFGDLRSVMADLPEAVPFTPQAQPFTPQAEPFTPRIAPPWIFRRRGPRILPVLALALLAALVIPGGGWLFFVFVKMVILFLLVACLAGILVASRIRRRMRRAWRFGYGRRWQPDWPVRHSHWHPYRRC